MPKKERSEAPLHYDVIIAYSSFVAASAGDLTYTGRAPFSKKSGCYSYNTSYEYFLQYCRKQGLRAAFATTKDIHDAGMFTSVWEYDTSWKRVRHTADARVIFDKFFPLEIRNRALHKQLEKHSRNVQFFHHPFVRKVFDDKLETFNVFPEYAIPTVGVDLRSEKTVQAAKKRLASILKRHPAADDFTATSVLKDRFGLSGQNVFKVQEQTALSAIGKKHPRVIFVLQPFVHASGFRIGKHVGNIDLRLIICNHKVAQCYIRIPKKGEFRANASQGGRVVYLKPRQIPADVMHMANAIMKKLPPKHSFYALDFIKSANGNLYFIEGNSTPGVIWFDAADERRVKQLIRLIVGNIQNMLR